MSRSAILLSGGLDSIALAYWKRPNLAITVDYGQVCSVAEIRAAQVFCQEIDMPHKVIAIDCSSLGSGDLSGKPKDPVAPESDWWPFRNQLLITLCGMSLLPESISKMLIGTVKSDGQHVDGTADFIEQISGLMRSQEGGVVVDAPAAMMTTNELIQASDIPLDLLAWGHSCHTSNLACGRCRGCNKHRLVMEAVGLGFY